LNALRTSPQSLLPSTALLACRAAAGGALAVAAVLKIQGGAKVFALSIDSFELVPQALLLPLAYYTPWLELIGGLALVLGLWTRQAAMIVVGIYCVFTIALASVLLRGMDVDCGCFGDIFGDSSVSLLTIGRNLLLLLLSVVPLVFGGGMFAMTREGERKSEPAPDQGQNAPAASSLDAET